MALIHKWAHPNKKSHQMYKRPCVKAYKTIKNAVTRKATM